MLSAMIARAQLDALIDNLDQEVPALLLATACQDCHLGAFAARADDIRGQAAPEDRVHAFTRLEAVAQRHGLVEPTDGAH